MKITFKVTCGHAARTKLQLTPVQDLKQNKFVIEAEPSETVRSRALLPTGTAAAG